MCSGCPISIYHYQQGDATLLWTQHDAEQPDRHLPDFACADGAASCRVDLAIQC